MATSNIQPYVPFVWNTSGEQTSCSLYTRIGTAAFGAIAAAVGILALVGVPGISAVGVIGGSILTAVGGLCLLAAIFIRQAKAQTSSPDSPPTDALTVPIVPPQSPGGDGDTVLVAATSAYPPSPPPARRVHWNVKTDSRFETPPTEPATRSVSSPSQPQRPRTAVLAASALPQPFDLEKIDFGCGKDPLGAILSHRDVAGKVEALKRESYSKLAVAFTMVKLKPLAGHLRDAYVRADVSMYKQQIANVLSTYQTYMEKWVKVLTAFEAGTRQALNRYRTVSTLPIDTPIDIRTRHAGSAELVFEILHDEVKKLDAAAQELADSLPAKAFSERELKQIKAILTDVDELQKALSASCKQLMEALKIEALDEFTALEVLDDIIRTSIHHWMVFIQDFRNAKIAEAKKRLDEIVESLTSDE